MNRDKKSLTVKKDVSLESFIFLFFFLGFFIFIGSKMGGVNMMNTMMQTAYHLLIDVCLYIMAIAVIAGAISGLLSEFGIVSLLNKLLSKIMEPIYDLPGVSSIGILTCYLSDNPAILTLAKDDNFLRYFKIYQLPAITNIGTSFGMGLIITTSMVGLNIPGSIKAALIGNLGAIIGSIVSVRLMLQFTKKLYGTEKYLKYDNGEEPITNMRIVRPGSVGSRAIESMLAGGKVGVDMGLAVIPGVLVICMVVLMLTYGPSESGTYTGAAYEGVGLLPYIGSKIGFILKPIFGFSSPESIAVPITALGSAGAAIGLIPKMAQSGLIGPNDVAVFTAMCMCWSGYLSTHIAMMDSLDFSELIGKAIFSHTIGGLVAGISANILFNYIF